MNTKRRNRLDALHEDVPVLEEKHLELPRASLQKTGDVIPGEKGGKKIGQLFRMQHLEGKTWKIPIEWITPNPNQPRIYKQFRDGDEEGDEDDGQIQPIMVVPYRTGKEIRFMIVGGELRYLRAKQQHIPTIVAQVVWQDNMDDIFETATFENTDRRDLNPIEKARAWRKIMDSYIKRGIAPDEVRARERLAKRLHRKPASLLVNLRLLELHEVIQEAVGAGILTGEQAESMGRNELHSEAAQELLAKKILEETGDNPEPLSGRTVDRMIREVKAQINTSTGKASISKVKVPPPKAPVAKKKKSAVVAGVPARGGQRRELSSFAPAEAGTVQDMCHTIHERAVSLTAAIDHILATLDGETREAAGRRRHTGSFMKKGLGAALSNVREAIKTLRVMSE